MSSDDSSVFRANNTPAGSDLSFATLRLADRARVPRFRNKHGGLAHAKPDGSDWTPADWLQALVGELGEYARVRHQFEMGQISREQYEVEARKELADVQIYLDLLAMRALDELEPSPGSRDASQDLQQLVAGLGEYANWRKKLDRGDITAEHFETVSSAGLEEAGDLLSALPRPRCARARVSSAHPSGVDLGLADV